MISLRTYSRAVSRPHSSQPRRGRRSRGSSFDIFRGVAEALRDQDRYGLLAQASQYLAVSRQPDDPFANEPRSAPSQEDLIASLIGTEMPEATAMLIGMGALATGAIQETIDDELQRRTIPPWAADLRDITVVGTGVIGHVLDDGESLVVGVQWPDGAGMTAIVYVDHNLGTIVKDAFVPPTPFEEVLATYHDRARTEPEMRLTDVDPADIRARFEMALQWTEEEWPPISTETWPQSQPLVEWIMHRLPADGAGYDFAEWTDDQLEEIVDEFLGSEHGQTIADSPYAADLTHSLLILVARYSPADPYHWSPVSVEMVLADRFPRKVIGPPDYMLEMPGVLRALVRFAHAQRGIGEHLTDETLQAVDRFEPYYRSIVGQPDHPSGLDDLFES